MPFNRDEAKRDLSDLLKIVTGEMNPQGEKITPPDQQPLSPHERIFGREGGPQPESPFYPGQGTSPGDSYQRGFPQQPQNQLGPNQNRRLQAANQLFQAGQLDAATYQAIAADILREPHN
jgi:hypothetical protein